MFPERWIPVALMKGGGPSRRDDRKLGNAAFFLTRIPRGHEAVEELCDYLRYLRCLATLVRSRITWQNNREKYLEEEYPKLHSLFN